MSQKTDSDVRKEIATCSHRSMFRSLTLTCRRKLCGVRFGTPARRLVSTNNLRLFNGDFEFHSAVFDLAEQKVLLQACLEKLDKTETRAYRKRRKQYLESSRAASSSIDSLFLPDEYYDFQMVGLSCAASSLAKNHQNRIISTG